MCDVLEGRGPSQRTGSRPRVSIESGRMQAVGSALLLAFLAAHAAPHAVATTLGRRARPPSILSLRASQVCSQAAGSWVLMRNPTRAVGRPFARSSN